MMRRFKEHFKRLLKLSLIGLCMYLLIHVLILRFVFFFICFLSVFLSLLFDSRVCIQCFKAFATCKNVCRPTELSPKLNLTYILTSQDEKVKENSKKEKPKIFIGQQFQFLLSFHAPIETMSRKKSCVVNNFTYRKVK